MTLELPPTGTRGANMRAFPIIRTFMKIFTSLYRGLGGRIGGDRMLALTTIGARSGQERTVLLAQFPDPQGRPMVVGAFAGAAKHPAWLTNLAHDPEHVWVQQGKERFQVRPEILTGDERTAAWDRLVAEAPGYAKYQTKTDREIPLIRLTRDELAPATAASGH